MGVRHFVDVGEGGVQVLQFTFLASRVTSRCN